MSSKTKSSERTSSASSGSTSVRYSRMFRSVPRSAELRICASAGAPPAAAYSVCSTVSSFWRITCAISLTTSGAVWPMRAIRVATSACSVGGISCITFAASSVVGRFASTSAIICGCSPRRKAKTWSGGVARRNSNGVCSITVASRERISDAFAAPTARSSTSRA